MVRLRPGEDLLTALAARTLPPNSTPTRGDNPAPQASAWREGEGCQITPWTAPVDPGRRAFRVREIETAITRCHNVTAPKLREQVRARAWRVYVGVGVGDGVGVGGYMRACRCVGVLADASLGGCPLQVGAVV